MKKQLRIPNSEFRIILLLCGGSKQTQNKDIDKAVEYLKQYKEEHRW